MPIRVKILISIMLGCAVWSVWAISATPGRNGLRFIVYLIVILFSAGLKVALPKGEGTMSVNFPFILLGILQLSPLQAVALAAVSVFAQCRIRVVKAFTFVQIAFNVANVIVATTLACLTFTTLTYYHLEMAPALALAATMYFFVNTVPVAFVIGWSTGEDPTALWRRQFPWYLPFYLVGAFLAAIVHLTSIHFGWMTSLLIVPTVYTIYRAYRAQTASIADRQRHLEETEALQLRTIEGLAMAIEAKDQGTHDHLLRVRVYVSEIGKLMNVDHLQMQALLTASLLHDIGKLAVPEYIINKPGKLTQEEFEKMKIHPVVGADILERVRFPYPVVPIVRSHHEAWDGSGYPDGLKGDEIPLGARILTVVDCFDALASDRPYRRALPIAEAMAMVKSRAGVQFDPNIVKILEENHVRIEEAARHEHQALAPLQTEHAITRGAAPGAGFAQESSIAKPPGAGDTPAVTNAPDLGMGLIAAASRQAQAIAHMAQSLADCSDPTHLCAVICDALHQSVSFDSFALYVKKGDFLLPLYLGGGVTNCLSNAQLPIGEGLSGWVARSGKAIVNGNPEVEPSYIGSRGVDAAMRSALSLPLMGGAGDLIGVLTLFSSTANFFSRADLELVVSTTPTFSPALETIILSQTEREILPASDGRKRAPLKFAEAT